MATSNLSQKSVGDVFIESGEGKPDHTSPNGSLYSDIINSTVYQNISGNTWEALSTVSYGEGSYQNNTTETSIGSQEWYAVENNFTEGETNGFSVVSGNTLELDQKLSGRYHVIANATLEHVANANRYECGVSVNGNAPTDDARNGTTVDSTISTNHIGISSYKDLNGGDYLQLAVGNLDSTDNIIIKHAQLFATKID